MKSKIILNPFACFHRGSKRPLPLHEGASGRQVGRSSVASRSSGGSPRDQILINKLLRWWILIFSLRMIIWILNFKQNTSYTAYTVCCMLYVVRLSRSGPARSMTPGWQWTNAGNCQYHTGNRPIEVDNVGPNAITGGYLTSCWQCLGNETCGYLVGTCHDLLCHLFSAKHWQATTRGPQLVSPTAT